MKGRVEGKVESRRGKRVWKRDGREEEGNREG